MSSGESLVKRDHWSDQWLGRAKAVSNLIAIRACAFAPLHSYYISLSLLPSLSVLIPVPYKASLALYLDIYISPPSYCGGRHGAGTPPGAPP